MAKRELTAEEALRERLNEYEDLLKEMVDGASTIGIIISGPVNEDGKNFYRVKVKGEDNFLVSTVKETLEEDVEVVVKDTFISRVLPKKLIVIKKPHPFKGIEWDEVGGLASQIEEIKRQVEAPIEMRSLYQDYGIQPSKGILLYGPPGCGKTLISKVIATAIIDKQKGSAESFVYIKGPELLEGLVGATEERIRNIFATCRKHTIETGSRSVIFIDEAEAILRRRGSGISSDVNMTIVPQFLSEMDGFDEHSPFVLLSTNLPQALDPAVIREGRIDLKVEISRPIKTDAVDIFQIHLKKVKLARELAILATHGADHLYEQGVAVSGSMIATICNQAATDALHRFVNDKRTNKGVTEADMETSIEKITNSQILS